MDSTPVRPATAPTLPGYRWQSENYDNGGQDIAYYDTTAINAGGTYRTNAVDIKATTDTGGGYLRRLDGEPREWLNYTVNVKAGRNVCA